MARKAGFAMTRPVTFFRYVAWENIDEFLERGWRLVGSMGAHRDEYGVLMMRDDQCDISRKGNRDVSRAF